MVKLWLKQSLKSELYFILHFISITYNFPQWENNLQIKTKQLCINTTYSKSEGKMQNMFESLQNKFIIMEIIWSWRFVCLKR